MSRQYRQALKSISERTGAPLPALIVSFGVLHEATAIVPLVGVFYGAKAMGVGEGLVDALKDTDTESVWWKGKAREWIEEGEERVDRVGRRYGWFGYSKGDTREGRLAVAGDVANAVVAH
ncbi:hypothetical protein VNI00_007352 [Paramarasmius palmivorus]|uniref:Uncharacterized protein n=1 Tax=Paramarasmius palmivorus TaxID=297713 RepID=A0AAW0D3H8_9AGAR